MHKMSLSQSQENSLLGMCHFECTRKLVGKCLDSAKLRVDEYTQKNNQIQLSGFCIDHYIEI